MDRTYRMYPDRVELILPPVYSLRYSEISQKTDGEHAWYISSHLRAAGVISLQNQGLLQSLGH